MVPTRRPETSVATHPSMLHNIPEERKNSFTALWKPEIALRGLYLDRLSVVVLRYWMDDQELVFNSDGGHAAKRSLEGLLIMFIDLDIWLAVHRSITCLLLPT